MKPQHKFLFLTIVLSSIVFACDICNGGDKHTTQTRLVRRMQPESHNSTSLPRGPLPWGQINFIHTTDTHGWLEGHLKEPDYGADWGDFASFVANMKDESDKLGTDLLVIDSGVSLTSIARIFRTNVYRIYMTALVSQMQQTPMVYCLIQSLNI
jgi:2',3'-cyclic-nucleotide 2'-phosphodiesterase (5'-nucleotidase family)